MKKQQNCRVRRMRQADVEAVETALVTARALGHKTVGYEALQAILGGVSPPVLWGVLKLSMRQAMAFQRPILVAMAVGKSGVPGRGFFDCLRQNGVELPATPESERAAWEMHVERVYSTPTEQL